MQETSIVEIIQEMSPDAEEVIVSLKQSDEKYYQGWLDRHTHHQERFLDDHGYPVHWGFSHKYAVQIAMDPYHTNPLPLHLYEQGPMYIKYCALMTGKSLKPVLQYQPRKL